MRRLLAACLVVSVTAAATALKLWIALNTYGSSDVWYWEVYLATTRELGAIALYHTDEHFNHPPFTTHALLWLGALADRTGLPFPFWLRVPAIVADVISVGLVAVLIARRPLAGRAGIGTLALLAVAPASVMVSGFHGNTDPVVMCFVLLAVVVWELRPMRWTGAAVAAVLAGVSFGMALNVKVVPLIFAPAFFLYVTRGWRFLFILCAGLAVFVGSLPYILQ